MKERRLGFIALLELAIFPNLRVLTNLEALQTLSLGVFMEALLHKHEKSPAIGGCSKLHPPPFPRGQNGRPECSNPPASWLAPLVTCPHPKVLYKSHPINLTKETFMSLIT